MIALQHLRYTKISPYCHWYLTVLYLESIIEQGKMRMQFRNAL